jgi:prepilin-type N-terminal cleavage/methylation domain-containing protein
MKKGFTLIEILIVIAIIAILASIVLVGLGPTQRAGRDARRVSDLRQVQNGLELYYNKCGYYPGAAAPCTSYSANNTWSGMTGALTGSSIGINTMPQDPTVGHTYYYAASSAGNSYMVAARLEDTGSGVFSNYTPPTLTGYTFGDADAPTSCAAPVYCLTL